MLERANVIWLDESDKNKKNVIYMLIFPNWKYYIGQTSQKLWVRIKKGHTNISDKPSNKKECAIKKYKTFHVMILDTCKDVDELNVKEQYWIELYDTFNNGYNSTTGGDVCRISNETRKKIGEFNRGKTLSNETRKKIGEFNKGKTISDEHRKRISKSHRGKTISDETRKKIGEGVSIKCKSIPDNITFDSIKKCIEYYSKYDKWLKIQLYLDNNKIHKKSGQTFVRVED